MTKKRWNSLKANVGTVNKDIATIAGDV